MPVSHLPLLPLPTPLQTLGIEAARNALLKELRGAWPGLLLLAALLAGFSLLACLHAVWKHLHAFAWKDMFPKPPVHSQSTCRCD